MRFSLYQLGLILLMALPGCVLKSKNIRDDLKRSWVRRLVPQSALTENEFAQNFSPILLQNGNLLQGTSFGNVFEVSPMGRKVHEYKLSDGVSSNGSSYQRFAFFGTLDKNFWCIDTLDKKVVWKVELEENIVSLSQFYNGTLFAMSATGSLYGLNAADGSVNWRMYKPKTETLTVFGAPPPVIYGKFVIAAFPNGSLASFDAQTGKMNWEVRLEGAQKYSDVDFLLLTSEDYLFAGTFDEALYRIDPKTGIVNWQAYESPVQSPIVFKDNIYFSSAEGFFVILNSKSGKILAKKQLFEGLGGVPLVTENRIVVSDSKGPIFLLDNTLNVLDRYELVSSISTKLLFQNNKFFVLSDKGYLYQFGF